MDNDALETNYIVKNKKRKLTSATGGSESVGKVGAAVGTQGRENGHPDASIGEKRAAPA